MLSAQKCRTAHCSLAHRHSMHTRRRTVSLQLCPPQLLVNPPHPLHELVSAEATRRSAVTLVPVSIEKTHAGSLARCSFRSVTPYRDCQSPARQACSDHCRYWFRGSLIEVEGSAKQSPSFSQWQVGRFGAGILIVLVDAHSVEDSICLVFRPQLVDGLLSRRKGRDCGRATSMRLDLVSL